MNRRRQRQQRAWATLATVAVCAHAASALVPWCYNPAIQGTADPQVNSLFTVCHLSSPSNGLRWWLMWPSLVQAMLHRNSVQWITCRRQCPPPHTKCGVLPPGKACHPNQCLYTAGSEVAPPPSRNLSRIVPGARDLPMAGMLALSCVACMLGRRRRRAPLALLAR
eukprot:COSAG01_NODE_4862_length_4677_cov_3.891219_6_plen_166_part_00